MQIAETGAPLGGPTPVTTGRLDAVVLLLGELATRTETDPDARLADLLRRRAQLDAEIARVRAGEVQAPAAPELRDLYGLVLGLADGLLADLHTAAETVTSRTRALRARLVAGDTALAGQLSAGGESADERASRALHDALLSPGRRETVRDLVSRVRPVDPDAALLRVSHGWLAAADRLAAARRSSAEQLRQDVHRRAFDEDREVLAALAGIERSVGRHTGELVTELDEAAPTVVLPLDRPLYSPPRRGGVDSSPPAPGVDETPVEPLPAPPAEGIRRALGHRARLDLTELLDSRPLRHGLAELVAHLALTDDALDVVVGDRPTEQVGWTAPDGARRVATLPRITFRSPQSRPPHPPQRTTRARPQETSR